MTHEEMLEEAALIIEHLAQVLGAIEHIAHELPEDVILEAAVEVFTAWGVEQGALDEHAQAYTLFALNTVKGLRGLISDHLDAVVGEAEGFLDDA